jgi:hypothetical protein
MNRPIVVTCLCVAALAGCTRTVVRESVVERPVVRESVVERPVVVEKPVVRETVVEKPVLVEKQPLVRETLVERNPIAVAPLACSYAGIGFTAGSLSCQSGYQYRCSSSGIWDRTGGYC